MVRSPTNLSVVENIPRVVATFDNKSGTIDWGNQWDVFSWDDSNSVKEYYTLIYRNQDNYLGNADKNVVSNYNLVGASNTGTFEFSDFTTDYQTSYTFISTSVEANVFLLTTEKYTGISEDKLDWEESWDTRSWSSRQFGNLVVEDISTLNQSIDFWDSGTWNFSWETYESVEDASILSKDGYKLSWSVEDMKESLHLIYRSTTSGKSESDYNLIGATKDNYFYDNSANTNTDYYYRVAYVEIIEESAPSNFAPITTGVPSITDAPLVESITGNGIFALDSSVSSDSASIQQFSSSQSAFSDTSVAYEPATTIQSIVSTKETSFITNTLEQGVLTDATISLLQKEFTSSLEYGTIEKVTGTSIINNAQSVAYEIELVTGSSITPSVATESSNTLDSPSPVSVNAAGVQSTDVIEITNAVTQVSSATAIGSVVTSGNEQTSATDASITQNGVTNTSLSNEFSSNVENGQVTSTVATSSSTPSLSAVTDGGFIVAESVSSSTPSIGGALEDGGITSPIIVSTIQSTENARVSDESVVTANFNTTVAPISVALAKDTPFNTSFAVTGITINALSNAINTPLTTPLSSQTSLIEATTVSTNGGIITNANSISSDSIDTSTAFGGPVIETALLSNILANDKSVATESGITPVSVTTKQSLDEFAQKFNAGERITQQARTINSTEQTFSDELAIPEPVKTFTFITASDGVAISPSNTTSSSITELQSTESAIAAELYIPELLISSSISVDSFTKSFEENDITVQEVSTPLVTTNSLEDSASLSQVNSTISGVSTLSVDNGFASATDRATIITKGEKITIAGDSVSIASDEGTITTSSISTQKSTEFTSSVDSAALTSTSNTSIISPDEFTSTLEEGFKTIYSAQTITQDALTVSFEADRLQQFAVTSNKTPSIGVSNTSGIQAASPSTISVNAFTFSIDGTLQPQSVTSFGINVKTFALEEGTVTSSEITVKENNAFGLSNEFNIEQTIDSTLAEINAQTSAATQGLSVAESVALTFDEFTSVNENSLITNVVGAAGTVAENILFRDTAIAKDAAGDEKMLSLSLLKDPATISYEEPTVTQIGAESSVIDASTFSQEEGSITTTNSISSDAKSFAISREDNRETNVINTFVEANALTNAIDAGTRTKYNNSSIIIDADTSKLEQGSITEKFAQSSVTGSIGVTIAESAITNASIKTTESFESITIFKSITSVTSNTGTTSLTTRDPEVTRAFERSRQPNLQASSIQSLDEDTSAIVKKAILPLIMEDVVEDEFAFSEDVPLIEAMFVQTFGDGQSVVNQEINELDLTTTTSTISQANIGISPVVSPIDALHNSLQSEETFVITSFLAEPRITPFSKQEDPLDAGAVRAPSINATSDSTTEVETNNSTTNAEIKEYSTELEVTNNGI